MSGRRQDREPATFRFDPHRGPGGPLGLGLSTSVALGVVVALGVLALYRGHPLAAALLLLGVAPIVLIRWDGLALLAFVVLRLAYAVNGPRRWEVDPELVGSTEPVVLEEREC